MDKIILRTSATDEDMWNALIDALYGDKEFDNEVINRLFTVFDYYNEMEKGYYEGFLEATIEDIQNTGFDTFLGRLIHGFEYIRAHDYIKHIRLHLPALYDAYFRYQGALNTGREIETHESVFLNTVNDADESYQKLISEIETKLMATIKEKKHYIFE